MIVQNYVPQGPRVRKSYNVIHVHTLPDFLVFSTIFPKFMGAKVILDMHEITPELFKFKYGLTPNSFFLKFLNLLNIYR